MIYKIFGKVVKGDGYGRKLGFPTANIDRKHFSRLGKKPKLGIWAGKVGKYRAGIVIGPIDKRGLPRVEAHLIGHTGSLYGKRLEFELISYLRPFKKYRGEADLRAQIQKDINNIKELKWKN